MHLPHSRPASVILQPDGFFLPVEIPTSAAYVSHFSRTQESLIQMHRDVAVAFEARRDRNAAARLKHSHPISFANGDYVLHAQCCVARTIPHTLSP